MEKIQDKFFAEIREKLKNLGIKAILFDFDDTLIWTSEIFEKYMLEFVSVVCEETGLDFDAVDGHLRKLNDEEYVKSGVNPSKWRAIVERMASDNSEYGESVLNNLNILMKIYSDEPRVKSGVKAMLEMVESLDVKVGMVTHANADWTWKKINSTKLIDFFDIVVIADENKHKESSDWKKAMDELNVLPEECLVVGDSLAGDIIPTAEIGARTFWLHNVSQWSTFRIGAVPENTVHLDDINQLLSALERLG